MEFIIKPLNDNYDIVELRTTILETAILDRKISMGLAEPIYIQKDEFIRKKTLEYGNICHDVFLTSCLLGPQAGRAKTNDYYPVLENMISEIFEKYKKEPTILKQLRYLLFTTLPRGDLIDISEQYPADYIEKEIPISIHCGKYKVEMITKIDHIKLGDTLTLLDLKTANRMRTCQEHQTYTVDNISGTCLENKLQMIFYSLAAMYAFSRDEALFKYLVFEKHDTKKKAKPFICKEFTFHITKEQAEEKVIEIMILFFKNIYNKKKLQNLMDEDCAVFYS